MKKIMVLGCPGSGKSIFAHALAEKTGIPLTPLDLICWRADGTHISCDAFDAHLSKIFTGDAFILDGDYSRTYEVRFSVADTVFKSLFGRTEPYSGSVHR